MPKDNTPTKLKAVVVDEPAYPIVFHELGVAADTLHFIAESIALRNENDGDRMSEEASNALYFLLRGIEDVVRKEEGVAANV